MAGRINELSQRRLLAAVRNRLRVATDLDSPLAIAGESDDRELASAHVSGAYARATQGVAEARRARALESRVPRYFEVAMP